MTSEWYREMVDPNTPMWPTSGRISSPIVQLDKDTLELVATHSTLREYVKLNNLQQHHYSGIYNNLNKTTKTAYGYVWMWMEDYEKFKNEHKD